MMISLTNDVGYRRFVDCDHEGVPIMREGEQMLLASADCEMSFYAGEPSLGVGKLSVTSQRILWIGATKSFDFDVAYIALHAITSDVNAFPQPCLYCQFDETDISEPQECFFVLVEGQKDDSFSTSGSDETNPTLRELFDTFSRAAAMNPDPEEGDDTAGEFIYNEAEVLAGSQQAALDRLESVFHVPTEFDD